MLKHVSTGLSKAGSGSAVLSKLTAEKQTFHGQGRRPPAWLWNFEKGKKLKERAKLMLPYAEISTALYPSLHKEFALQVP